MGSVKNRKIDWFLSIIFFYFSMGSNLPRPFVFAYVPDQKYNLELIQILLGFKS